MSDYSVEMNDVEEVISTPLQFKYKLAIGEDAYTFLRVKKNLMSVWDTAGAAGTAGALAGSSTVASTFFASNSLLAAIGLGGTAVTPIGWVIAAAVVGGSAWLGLSKFMDGQSGKRVSVIPEYINTPIDVLGLSLFNYMTPLALKVAAIDNKITDDERQVIADYMVTEWGFNQKFVDVGLKAIEEGLDEYKIQTVASDLAEFKQANPDCNFQEMSKEIVNFLQEVAEADGELDEREVLAINSVKSIFEEAGKVSYVKAGVDTTTAVAGAVADTVKSAGNTVASSVVSAKDTVVPAVGGVVHAGTEKVTSVASSIGGSAVNAVKGASGLFKKKTD